MSSQFVLLFVILVLSFDEAIMLTILKRIVVCLLVLW